MTKPRIKKDTWKPSGFTCRSKEIGGWKGDFTLIASGDTPEQAYFNWRYKRMTDPRFAGTAGGRP